jgi:phage N-6-adenine-methyltransferase
VSAELALIPMTEEEARACVVSIQTHLNSARAKVYELYSREGWRVLGYNSWGECVEKEFRTGIRHVQREFAAAQVEIELRPIGRASETTLGSIPEYQLRPLTSVEIPGEPELEAKLIQKLWQVAVNTAPEGKVTGAHVQSVVDVMTGIIEAGGLDDGSGEAKPLGQLIDAAITEETYERMMRQKEYIKQAAKPHVAHNSGENEWYTPPEYIVRAHALMGGIDLDPASSDHAQLTVQAAQHYTKEVDGLAQGWSGRVWMNPPYASGLIEQFTDKLAQSYLAGDVREAVVLVNNATDTGWFQRMGEAAHAVLFIRGRVRFIGPNGEAGAPLQGQAVLYFGDNASGFAEAFGELGLVLRRDA